ncbi:MAG TPA: hypothetical protein VF841_09945 [Anaeromyxobacter sp.]
MIRMLLAAAAAFALTTAAPAYACPDCASCPKHKVAATDKADAKDAKDGKVADCPCGKGADCKCGDKCDCPHCHGAKAEKKEAPKKS